MLKSSHAQIKYGYDKPSRVVLFCLRVLPTLLSVNPEHKTNKRIFCTGLRLISFDAIIIPYVVHPAVYGDRNQQLQVEPQSEVVLSLLIAEVMGRAGFVQLRLQLVS